MISEKKSLPRYYKNAIKDCVTKFFLNVNFHKVVSRPKCSKSICLQNEKGSKSHKPRAFRDNPLPTLWCDYLKVNNLCQPLMCSELPWEIKDVICHRSSRLRSSKR